MIGKFVPNVKMMSAADSSLDVERLNVQLLCPVDGRYWDKTKELSPFMSEFGLMRYRVLVEIRWLLKLSQISEIPEIPMFSEETESYLENIFDSFIFDDALEVKEIEKVTNHDVKAVEYFLKQKCQSHPEISKVLEFFHFACTSEDINNLAYALMLKEALSKVIVPEMDLLISAIGNLGTANASIPMLSRTHGQPTSPTTLGKEMAIYVRRLRRERNVLSRCAFLGKFAGAVGNYNAHLIAYPDVNWPQIAEEFVTSFGLSFNPLVNQIEPHDYMAEIFDSISLFNNFLLNFDRDIWNYISLGHLKQLTKAGEIGSSTMPHKVNPIDFENSDGNCGPANAELFHFSSKLPISRLQRDLTDSTVLRNMGVPLGHSLLAYKATIKGIAKLQVNEASFAEDLNKYWEVLAETIETGKMISDVDSSLDVERSSVLYPLDGCYWDKVKELSPFLSEFGLIRYRVLVEIRWLLKLSQMSEIPEISRFSEETETYLENIFDSFILDDALEVKKIEKLTNHDVEAVEYFLKQKCQSYPEISKVLEFFRFACTSEDINNLAHALILKEALSKVILPEMDLLISEIRNLATANASIPMLSRTHGQPASPTTLGKEMAIFVHRLSRQRNALSCFAILGNFAGAVGNYNAHQIAYRDVNWPQIAEEFVTSLGLSFDPSITQIESHDYMLPIFNSIRRFSNILISIDRDTLSYISSGYFKQITKAGEIGPSTMSHKVNPFFENSDRNCGDANRVLSQLSFELLISRWQRDLTDSAVLTNMGIGLGHSLLSYKATINGIAKLQVNETSLAEDLNKFWEVLAEPIQTIMRRYGVPEPYEKLKALTRGQEVNRESIREFINVLDIPSDAKARLLDLTPHSYIGAAAELAKSLELDPNPLSNCYLAH